MMCKKWIELDNEMGIFEYCKGANRKCSCSGESGQCDYPQFCEVDEDDIIEEIGVEEIFPEDELPSQIITDEEIMQMAEDNMDDFRKGNYYDYCRNIINDLNRRLYNL